MVKPTVRPLVPVARTRVPTGAQAGAVLAIAPRNVTKFLANRPRIVSTFMLPFLLVVILGGSFTGFGDALGFDYGTFIFTGVFAQTMFQSAALGLVSLLEDRETDFSQELFVFLPQFLLTGVFNPISALPPLFDTLSRLAPLRYAVDLTRTVFYAGNPDRPKVVVDGFFLDALVVTVLFTVFLVAGTALFVRNERNR